MSKMINLSRYGIFIFIIGFLLPVVLFAKSTTAYKAINKIDKGKSVEILVKGKKRNYHEISKTNSVQFSVEGPKKVMVRSRLVLPADFKGSKAYRITYNMDNKKDKTFKEKTQLSTSARFSQTAANALGSSMIYEFTVPAGKHTYRFAPEGDETILVKFYEKPLKKKKSWKKLSLDESNPSLQLVTNQANYEYYLIKKDKPITFTIEGPGQLKILSRLNFQANMAGSQNYTLLIKNKGNNEIQKSLTAKKSKKYTYKNKEDVVPGIANTTVIEIAKGKHEYSLTLMGTEAETGSLRLLYSRETK